MGPDGKGRRGLRSRWTTWAVIGLVALAAIGTPVVLNATRREPERKMVYSQIGTACGYEMGAWVAKEKGLFEKYGLSVELIRTDPSTQVVVLVSGQCDLIAGSPLTFLSSQEVGAACLDIAGFAPAIPWIMVARPEIRDAGDLEGIRFAVNMQGINTVLAATPLAFAALGVDPKQAGVTYEAVGPGAERLAAVVAGSADATLLLVDMMPKLQPLIDEGKIHILVDLTQTRVPWADNDLMVTKDFAAENPEAVDGFLRAIIEAHAWVLDPANKAEALTIIARYAGLDSSEQAGLLYQQGLKNISVRPYPSAEAIQSMVDALIADYPELGAVKVTDFVDRSWIQRLDDEGFMDEVAGGK